MRRLVVSGLAKCVHDLLLKVLCDGPFLGALFVLKEEEKRISPRSAKRKGGTMLGALRIGMLAPDEFEELLLVGWVRSRNTETREDKNKREKRKRQKEGSEQM